MQCRANGLIGPSGWQVYLPGRMAGLVVFLLLAALAIAAADGASGAVEERRSKTPGATADHNKFEVLKGPFTSGPEVTKACLSCHTEASQQVMNTIHWTWEFKHPVTGQLLGKRHTINSFCGNLRSNEPRCTSCHAGYGWRDANFNFNDPTKVDCLVCHDQTGTYQKWPTGAGHPLYEPRKVKGKTVMPPDLAKVAQSAGLPRRANCGACHFYGGGGDNIKHGDLSSALVAPDRQTDVHMAKDGLNFACSACHVSKQHTWPGSRYSVVAKDEKGRGKPGLRRDVATCEACHGINPHKTSTLKGLKLNDHVSRVACQTCHIPTFARGGVATKTDWDWSKAGRLRDGKPFSIEDYRQQDGKMRHTYLSTKGEFEWGENVVPHYAWFDGQMRYTLRDDIIDPGKVVELNRFEGAPGDERARIWPFKRMKGKQPYDKEHLTLLYNQVFGPKTDTAFWTNFDWSKSLRKAQEDADRPFSGNFGFVNTYMYWPITHMVAPKGEALTCESCHAKGGRLAGLAGFYMPGRDRSGLLDGIGLFFAALTLLGVLAHAALRIAGRWGKGLS